MRTSYSDIFGVTHARGYEQHIAAGDTVATGPNLFPHFVVIHVDGDTAWVRNVQNGQDGFAPLANCRKIQLPLSIAAE